jgi:hypothetical protein
VASPEALHTFVVLDLFPCPTYLIHNLCLQAGMTVTDDPEEENKQRTFKGILNKLTPDNFERLSQQLLDVGITEAKTLIGLIAQVIICLCNVMLWFYVFMQCDVC